MTAGSPPRKERVQIPGLDVVREYQGTELGATDWFVIDQERIALFASATGDTRWIHTDPERAAREAPWKNTIVDGFLLLSLVPHLLPELVAIGGWTSAVNVGADRCQFPGVVTAGARVRLGARLSRARPLPPNGARAAFDVWFEVEGQTDPVARARVNYAYFA